MVYALPGEATVIQVVLDSGATITDAIQASGILQLFPEIDLSNNKVGVFSRLKSPGDMVYDGDRVEIYRSLTIDPKEARRRRAARRKNN